jgi:invasion protein IalB
MARMRAFNAAASVLAVLALTALPRCRAGSTGAPNILFLLTDGAPPPLPCAARPSGRHTAWHAPCSRQARAAHGPLRAHAGGVVGGRHASWRRQLQCRGD